MTKKDYEVLSQVFAEERERWKGDIPFHRVIDVTAKKLCDKFEEDNNRFDRDRFLIACGVPR